MCGSINLRRVFMRGDDLCCHAFFDCVRITKGEVKMDIVAGIIWIACSFAVWIIYHRLFSVVYFDVANGCLKEIIISGIIGAILAGLILLYWYIAVPLVIFVIIALLKKN